MPFFHLSHPPHSGKRAGTALTLVLGRRRGEGICRRGKAERHSGFPCIFTLPQILRFLKSPPFPPRQWEEGGFPKGWSLFPEFPRLLSRPRLHFTCVRFPPCTIQPVAYFARRLAPASTPETGGRCVGMLALWEQNLQIFGILSNPNSWITFRLNFHATRGGKRSGKYAHQRRDDRL